MKTDVLIIGGGVIGVCAALYLIRAGRQVTLLEKSDIGAGASHGNAGWVAVAHAVPTAAPGVMGQGMRWLLDPASPFYIKPRLDLDLARWLWGFRRAASSREKMMAGTALNLALNRRSLTLFQALHDEGLRFDFARRGLLHLHLSEKYRRAGIAEMELLAQFGIAGHVVDRRDLAELQPGVKPAVQSGIFYPEPAHLRPDKLIRVVSCKASQEGATVLTGTAVTRFEVSGDRIVGVHTAQGVFQAREVVLAAGAWSAPLAKMMGIYLPMEPAKGYSVTARRPAPDLGPMLPVAIDDYKIAVTPLGNDFRFSSTLELAGFDPSINPRRLAANFRGLNAVFPGMNQLSIKEVWAGYRPLTADGMPIIGRSQKLENLIVATGHGMLGITQGPATGEMVVGLVKKS